ncbi:hypothetical protein HNP33_003737 [Comamonas odontotermitis]|uniref:Uncharacterized protein n=1 Tax=Comamonas odontotermitis TaxID=379895 RepID=A0ABR6RKB5_9BURK|nr:hypothetical protein [Comamonas odontotermitis]MBB6579623.1 hypothetical protein [Comamonas odontotermitis]
MSDSQNSWDTLSGRMLANEAVLESLLLAVLSDTGRLAKEVMANLDDQQEKADRILDGAAHSGFSDRLQAVKKVLIARYGA